MSTQEATPPSVSASIHLYRGLMDRATTWRQRIDSPTNWAITTGGTVASFTLGDEFHSHAILLLAMLLTFAFLMIEARRMRYYDLWASWVRVLETDYLAEIARDGQVAVDRGWERLIIRDFEDPHFKESTRQLVVRRLRDNYMAIFLFLLLCWLLKLLIHQPLDQGFQADSLIARAAVGPLPGTLVFAGVMVVYVVLLVFTLLSSRGQINIEVLARDAMLRRMLSPHQQQVSQRQSEAAMLERFISEEDDRLLGKQDWD